MAVFDDLRQLVHNFYRDVDLAKDLIFNNPEDELAIKTSVVGFSYNSPTCEWDKQNYNYVRRRLDSEYRLEQMVAYGTHGENVRLFFSLALGYLLGLYQQGAISDSEFKEAEVQLPGLIMYYLPALTVRNT